MGRLRTAIVENLRELPGEWLDEITADGQTFAASAWYRLLDQLTLGELIGGRIELSYAVATVDELPIAVCPILRASGEGVYFVYSLRQFYFEHWIEEAVRMEPERREYFARLFSLVSAFRRVLEWTGTTLDDCLIVTSPLSYRGHIPVAPSSPVPRAEVYGALIAELKRTARQRRLPLCFLGIEAGERRLQQALTTAGCTRSFLFYDNQLNLEPFASFEDYLQSFRRTTRRALQKDMRRTEEAGIEFRFEEDWRSSAVAFTELYNQTYGKYGESYFHHPPWFWTALNDCLPGAAEAILAERAGKLIGFSILLKNARRGEMWTYRVGRSAAADLAAVPYYFGLSFYGPIQRALALGYRRLWLGPASYETKSVRGAQQVPLYSYFWSPRRTDRWCLLPYLQLFGKITEEQISKSLARPLRPAAAPSEDPSLPKDTTP